MKSIAIVYHYLAHYRQQIFIELGLSKEPSFTFISDKVSTNDIKLIDENLANLDPKNGGLNWKFVKNIWFGKDKLLWQKGLMRICLSDQFDGYIFLGNPYFISTWVGTIILKLRGKTVYFWTHGVLKKDKGIKGLIRNIFLKLPDGLFLYGNYARNLLLKQGFNSEKLHVIFNSLDYKRQVQLRESLSNEALANFRSTIFKNPELPQLMFIGRLTKQKKLHQIIEAMYLLRQQRFPLNLLFIGPGDLQMRLQKMIKEKELNNFVSFFGESYIEEDNYKLIASSDICISPGEVGLTAMHSLVYGTPVITHNNFGEQGPEFEAIEEGISGDFFVQDNIVDLAHKIKKWLINHPNKEEVKKNCYSIIDSKYNPKYQKEIICKVLKNEKLS